MNEITLLVVTTIGGFFLGGIKNAIGRWLVTQTFSLFKKLFIKSERDMAIYLRARNEKHRQLAAKQSGNVHE